MDEPEHLLLDGDDRFPNSALPVVLYRAALPGGAEAVEHAFAAQGWLGSWRDGIFSYDHYHSITHEVLGIASGKVTVLFGGPSGEAISLQVGDVVVIPAGVAHRNIGQSADLLVIGAYPGGADCDLLRGDPAELAKAKRAIAAVPLPSSDPVPGRTDLARLWS